MNLHETNRKKGGTLRTGVASATGDVVVTQHADLEYDPAAYPLLLDPIARDVAGVVGGLRVMRAGPHRVLYFGLRVGDGPLTLLSNMLTDLNLNAVVAKADRGLARAVRPLVRIAEDCAALAKTLSAQPHLGLWAAAGTEWPSANTASTSLKQAR